MRKYVFLLFLLNFGFAVDFSVVVPSYNNERWCEWNLNSILSQSVQNYTVYYIDDASTDATLCRVQKFLKTHPQGKKVKVIHNYKNKGALANIHFAVSVLVPQHHVVVLVDGDDALAHRDVLKNLGRVYQDGNVWMTYGQFQEKNSKKRGFCVDIIPPVRKFPHAPSHLKTFYAWLFKKIKQEDLMEQGCFFKMCSDIAIMLPMMEMAGKHSRFISEILYIYNDGNPLSDHMKNKALQMKLDKDIRKKPPYPPINR